MTLNTYSNILISPLTQEFMHMIPLIFKLFYLNLQF